MREENREISYKMKTAAFIMMRCALCAVLCAALTSCKTKTTPDATSKKVVYNAENYDSQAGDRVRLTGVFKTTKGYMGVVNGILIPHFLNRDEEALKYKDKWVTVTGTLTKRTYPEGPDVQRWLGLELEMESIEIIATEGEKQEMIEKL